MLTGKCINSKRIQSMTISDAKMEAEAIKRFFNSVSTFTVIF